MPIDIVIASLLSAIVSLIAGIYSSLNSRRKRKIDEANKQKYLNKFNELWAQTYLKEYKNNYKDENKWFFLLEPKEYDKNNWRNVLSNQFVNKSETEIESAVKERIEEIKNRVEDIEKRFPKDSTLEKIASVNDAILATQIEGLTASIKRLEEKILTKWDVAKIVFAILSVLGLIVGLVFAIIQYFKT